MQNMLLDRPWLRHLEIAVGYAITFAVLRIFLISHWQLTEGLRLACLLLLPLRYWPALFIGEAAALGKVSYDCVDQLGLPWALVFPFASMSLAMPAIFLIRRYCPVMDADKRIIISSLLICILVVSLLNVGADALEYALMQGLSPEKRWSVSNVSYYSFLWLLGAGLGIYMVVPIALWIYSDGETHLRKFSSRIVQSRALVDSVTILSPCLYVFAYTIEYTHLSWLRHIAQIGMLLSPALLAVRYGWKGASLGCMLANLAVVLSMPAFYDPTTLQTQVLMAASSTLWILVGARVSSVRQEQMLAH